MSCAKALRSLILVVHHREATTMIVKTTCSNCRVNLVIDDETTLGGTIVRAQVPSNGKRGSLHVPAHEEVTDAWSDDSGSLIQWDCPVCEYADSFDTIDGESE